jgi:hypothetical protein
MKLTIITRDAVVSSSLSADAANVRSFIPSQVCVINPQNRSLEIYIVGKLVKG